ncbi:hypothetical protein B6N60_03384 [Richelia sinica FACHB-800]|uniref:Photosystem II assembly protein n=1 Tax=Richelia sinica FACHB-800 TaxID=1357546 RepID=A0A975TAW9_9NOST|nr:photosystem II assembly protein [Richelia sinica]MBD2663491.1 photosystem II assembly protein [Richelia sinica FACHB-800]QXE24677.1 hypothetical protein B6N60_03384 [Richelia sinica FACHB-800]
MSNIFVKWWLHQQFKSALNSGNTRKAIQLLKQIQSAGFKLSYLEQLFKDKLKLERTAIEHQREIINLRKQVTEVSQRGSNLLLNPAPDFLQYIYTTFNLVDHDDYKIQVTGIDAEIFDDLEQQLVEYIETEFKKYSETQLRIKIEDAMEDLHRLKVGQDPDYGFSLTPHIYFMKYFLENVYCLSLAWFLIYQQGLISTQLKILDIGAGPGTAAYGLALFLQSCSNLMAISPMHISYYSLEKQESFQYRGLQFWRRYIESQMSDMNAYFRFVTADIFTLNIKSSQLPKNFFDFIIVSHCFFNDLEKSQQANHIYKQIFTQCLNDQGYVLLIVQDKKLFKICDAEPKEDKSQEKNLVENFLKNLGLELVWYKYLTSTGLRNILSSGDFAKFAQEKLPKQSKMSPILQKYTVQKYQTHYALDDYVILAKRLSAVSS